MRRSRLILEHIYAVTAQRAVCHESQHRYILPAFLCSFQLLRHFPILFSGGFFTGDSLVTIPLSLLTARVLGYDFLCLHLRFLFPPHVSLLFSFLSLMSPLFSARCLTLFSLSLNSFPLLRLVATGSYVSWQYFTNMSIRFERLSRWMAVDRVKGRLDQLKPQTTGQRATRRLSHGLPGHAVRRHSSCAAS